MCEGVKPIMKYEMKIEPRFLYARLSGGFSLKEAKSAFLVLMDTIAENRCGNVLVDGREVTGNIRLLERFLYGEYSSQVHEERTRLQSAVRIRT